MFRDDNKAVNHQSCQFCWQSNRPAVITQSTGWRAMVGWKAPTQNNPCPTALMQKVPPPPSPS
jgi:hypothetical protein